MGISKEDMKKLLQIRQWHEVIKKFFEETDIAKRIQAADTDWFSRYKLDYKYRVRQLQITHIASKSIKGESAEQRVNYELYLDEDIAPLLLPYDIVQFSYVDKHKNHYRFSIHYSSNAEGEYITIHARYIPAVSDLLQTTLAEGLDKAAVKLALQILDRGGLFLVGGGYGQGKTTFVYYLLSEWMHKYEASQQKYSKRFIITLEDVVENYLPAPSKQLEIPENLWIEALRAVRRENPSLLFIGEILDHRMANVLIQYAASGLPVITTIHASSTANIFNHLVSLLSLAGIKDPAGAIAYATTGTTYVEMMTPYKCPTYNDDKTRQLAEVVSWKQLFDVNILKKLIEEDTINKQLYTRTITENHIKRNYIHPLWVSAQRFGYLECAERLKRTMTNQII